MDRLQVLKEALNEVYNTTDAFVYSDIISAEFTKEYIVFNVIVFNAGSVVTDFELTNDVDTDDYDYVFQITEVVDYVADWWQEIRT